MPGLYHTLMHADLSVLTDLAKKWKSFLDRTEDLPGRIGGEVLKPLRDEGYWEGVAAPYAWQMIDDMQRQILHARDVAKKVKKVLEDGLSEFSDLRGELRTAVKEVEEGDATLQVDGSGNVKTTYVGMPSPEAMEKIRAGQEKVNAVLRKAVLADKRFAYALMADIGAEPWFNPKPEHTSINTNDRISSAEYTAYNRAMRGETAYGGGDSSSPYSIGTDYLFGKGVPDRTFQDGDKLTELIQRSDSMKGIREEIRKEVNENHKFEGSAHYSIAKDGYLGATKKLLLEDAPAVLTGDEDGLGQAFTGSYDVKYEVVGKDDDGSLVVRYILDNKTSNSSVVHYLGYGEWQKKLNTETDGVPGRTVSQHVEWTERIPADGK